MTIFPRLRLRRALSRTLSGILCAAACAPAWASLGEPQASVNSDAQALHGAVTSVQRAAFTVMTITLQNGTTVNEYIPPGGNVVAVSWRGLRPPDLSQLLGTYYAGYQAMLAARQPGGRRRHLLLSDSAIVFESGGHMRDLRGSAYLPAQMPQGISAGDLN